MKKLITLLITGAMLLSAFSITAYADDNTAALDNNNLQTSVSATYTTDGADYWNDVEWDDATIAVNVSWSATEFVYHFGTVWNSEKHEYEDGSGWDDSNYFDVYVTNHSNCPVNVAIENINKIDDSMTLEFENDRTSANLTSAIDPNDVNANLNKTAFYLTFDYTPTSFVDEATNLFSFNVVISQID